ncbi:Alpha-catulin [Branchiostoma belcheri]|nr:Alpha-catulin [Branchiostoma belcheri]
MAGAAAPNSFSTPYPCRITWHLLLYDPRNINIHELALFGMTPFLTWAAKGRHPPRRRLRRRSVTSPLTRWGGRAGQSHRVNTFPVLGGIRAQPPAHASAPPTPAAACIAKVLFPRRRHEQAKIAKLGLEMKLMTSELDAETEKWEDPDNDIVKKAQNMSSMSYSMYLFTRGEGPLKTTQDLFSQAENTTRGIPYRPRYQPDRASDRPTTKGRREIRSAGGLGPRVMQNTHGVFSWHFAEEGNKLFKTVKDFSEDAGKTDVRVMQQNTSTRVEAARLINEIPDGVHKAELLAHLDKIPTFCQQLNFTCKSPTVGKQATFTKVDSAIQETKNLMNTVAKVVTTCFTAATKYNLDTGSSPVNRWRSGPPPPMDIRTRRNGEEGTPPHTQVSHL